MVDERTYNLVKRDLKKGIKQYKIAEKRKLDGREITEIKRSSNYEEYAGEIHTGDEFYYSNGLPLFEQVPGQVTLEDLLAEIKEVRQEVKNFRTAFDTIHNIVEVPTNGKKALVVKKKEYAG